VNVFWRTLLVMLRARLRARGGLRPLTDVHRIRVRVLPTDIDVLRHLNNGRYLSLFDLGRWDMLERTGLTRIFRGRRWYAVVSNETITFRRSLKLWQRFDLETRWIGHDDRALYMEHRAVVDGEIHARAIVRARILGPDGPVSHDDLFRAVDVPDGLPEVDDWLHAWAEASALPSARRSAPSVWDD
jgi:acyl-CoA thioesterase FadM